MNHDILHYAKKRHTTKSYKAGATIPKDKVQKLKNLLRYSPSSTNGQPWHFIFASSEEGKARIAKSTEDKYAFNTPSILNASHVVVFASRLEMTDEHLRAVLEQEEKDGRFQAETQEAMAELKGNMHGGRSFFINIHKQHYKDVQHWMDKQVYLNIGQFLLGAATLGIDATPMEGVDIDVLDEEFGLRDLGYSSLVVVTLGYHDPKEDFNAALPKSRLGMDYIMTEV